MFVDMFGALGIDFYFHLINVMDWQIRPLSKKSSVSGADFSPGDRVICAIFEGEFGVLDREDFLKDELESFQFRGNILGKWERVVSENPEEDERAARRMALAGSEDFFLSLFDEASGVETEEKDLIKQMLSLLLERKRVLKARGRPAGGVQKYLHTASGRELDVPQKDLTQDLVLKIQQQLDSLML